MKTKPDTPRKTHGSASTSDSQTARVIQPKVIRTTPTTTKTTTQLPASNSVRATTITVILEEILTHDGYLHGGINE